MRRFFWFGKDADQKFPENDENFFGLENALYHCQPFRKKLLAATICEKDPANDQNGDFKHEYQPFRALQSLFHALKSQKKKTGWLSPKTFVFYLRASNESFRNFNQQDAHEFFNYIINYLADTLEKDMRQSIMSSSHPSDHSSTLNLDVLFSERGKETTKTWIHALFEGILHNETQCLGCDNITIRKETFLDLSIEIISNYSVTAALNNFSEVELLNQGNKFFCDNCNAYQDAKRRMKIYSAPPVLVLHLKRFKYMDNYNRFIKLNHRVPFPLEMRLMNMTDDSPDLDRLYMLISVIVHIGSGPNQGHYVTVIRTDEKWICFDDDAVNIVEESYIYSLFGSRGTPSTSYSFMSGGNTIATTETGYMLFYQAKGVQE